MADAAELRLAIIADASKARNELSGVEGSVGKLSGTVKGIAGGFAAAFAVDKIKDFAVSALGAADESAKVAAKTQAIITATGSAAGITAQQVGDLSEALSTKTAVDDEAIQTGANMLLTFKNVRNEAGKGADVFNRATAAAVDLSSAGFGSIESASVMLGKALNDPVKGMTALAKSGVTFTEQQQEQIKTLVASNDVLGAQKIILGEVESQVGGTAAASASSMDKVKLAFSNAMERIGAALLPVVDQLLPILIDLLDFLVPVIQPVLAALGQLVSAVVGALIPALQPLIPVIGLLAQSLATGLTAALVSLVPAIAQLVPALVSLLTALMPILPMAAKLIVAVSPILTLLAQLITIVVELAAKLVGPMLTAIQKLLIPFEKLGQLAGAAGGFLKKLPGPFALTEAGVLVPVAAGYGAPAYRAAPLARSITINVASPLGQNPHQIGNAVVVALRRWEARNGPYGAGR